MLNMKKADTVVCVKLADLVELSDKLEQMRACDEGMGSHCIDLLLDIQKTAIALQPPDRAPAEPRTKEVDAMWQETRDAGYASPPEAQHEHRWVGRGEAGSSAPGYMCADCGVDADDLGDEGRNES